MKHHPTELVSEIVPLLKHPSKSRSNLKSPGKLNGFPRIESPKKVDKCYIPKPVYNYKDAHKINNIIHEQLDSNTKITLKKAHGIGNDMTSLEELDKTNNKSLNRSTVIKTNRDTITLQIDNHQQKQMTNKLSQLITNQNISGSQILNNKKKSECKAYKGTNMKNFSIDKNQSSNLVLKLNPLGGDLNDRGQLNIGPSNLVTVRPLNFNSDNLTYHIRASIAEGNDTESKLQTDRSKAGPGDRESNKKKSYLPNMYGVQKMGIDIRQLRIPSIIVGNFIRTFRALEKWNTNRKNLSLKIDHLIETYLQGSKNVMRGILFDNYNVIVGFLSDKYM